MRIERDARETRIVLSEPELHLFKHALERALLIDTPTSEQEAIARFCQSLLQELDPTHRG